MFSFHKESTDLRATSSRYSKEHFSVHWTFAYILRIKNEVFYKTLPKIARVSKNNPGEFQIFPVSPKKRQLYICSFQNAICFSYCIDGMLLLYDTSSILTSLPNFPGTYSWQPRHLSTDGRRSCNKQYYNTYPEWDLPLSHKRMVLLPISSFFSFKITIL